MFHYFESLLKKEKLSYTLLTGNLKRRLKKAEEILKMLKNNIS
jgi:hypothetical protein